MKNDPFDKTQGHPERSRTDDNSKCKNKNKSENFKFYIVVLHFDF